MYQTAKRGKMDFLTSILVFGFILGFVESLDNGLARVPPMGWVHWKKCETNCEKHPNDCISEKLFRDIAHKMHEDGYVASGYKYLIIDDCWMAPRRDLDGKLEADPSRFPSGILKLAKYVHKMHLLLGIYENYGLKTCGGFPGSTDDHLQTDAETFADWQVDLLKFDVCDASNATNPEKLEEAFSDMEYYLDATGRRMVFSCGYPKHHRAGKKIYGNASWLCNTWRIFPDIHHSWESVHAVYKWVRKYHKLINQYSGIGHWSDLDSLVIGSSLTLEQSEAQMAFWCILPAPLIISADIRTIKPEYRKILLNANAIRINQDELQSPAFLASATINRRIDIWIRPIRPISGGDYASYAIAFIGKGVEMGVESSAETVNFSLRHLSRTINSSRHYAVTDVFAGGNASTEISVSEIFTVIVKKNGAVLLLLEAL